MFYNFKFIKPKKIDHKPAHEARRLFFYFAYKRKWHCYGSVLSKINNNNNKIKQTFLGMGNKPKVIIQLNLLNFKHWMRDSHNWVSSKFILETRSNPNGVSYLSHSENPESPEKIPQNREHNQLDSQPKWDTRSDSGTKITAVGKKIFHQKKIMPFIYCISCF